VDNSERIAVMGQDGLIGWIYANELAQDGQDTPIHLEDGRLALAPATLLKRQADGSFYLPLRRTQLDPAGQRDEAQRVKSETVTVIPLAEEVLQVERQTSERQVRLLKRVQTRTERIEDAGYKEHIEVERVAVNRPVEQAPPVRTEGDTTIIPLVEEVLVVEKRLVVREEVRVTLRRKAHEPMEVSLRSEELDIERPDGSSDLTDRAT